MEVKRFLAIDATMWYTVSRNRSTTAYGGRISELMAGVRVEAGRNAYGYYIEAQPGYCAGVT